VFEKCLEELFVVDLHGSGVDGGDEFVVGCRNKIRQVHVFDLIPTWLNRVQLRRIRRKILELEPTGMRIREVRVGGVVGRKVVPNDDDLVTVKMMNVRQKENQVLRPHGTFEDREAKLEQVTLRSSRDETKPGMIVATRRFKNGRCLTDRRPGVVAIRRKREAAFVR